jgi:hypothetical protein
MNQEEFEEKNEDKIVKALGIVYGKNRGGQPGNQNARTHGFYSQVLTAEQKANLEAAASLTSLEQEIALMRLKILSILSQQPVNDEVLMKAISMLTKMLKVNYHLPCRFDQSLQQVLRRD